jgi:septal ring factor EnvC (AmiA/AmiB activator)
VTRAARLAGLALAALLLGAPALADRRADLEALREAIAASRKRVSDYEREERGLLEVLETLDRTAALLERELATARSEADAAQLELAGIEAEAFELERRLRATERAMSQRAVALYRAGDLGTVRLLFSADGLPEFLSRVSSLRLLLEHDADLLARHQAQSAALEEARVRVGASAERLGRAEAELAERQQEIGAERAQRQRLVTRLHSDRARERSALVELEKAARALEETLASLGARSVSPGPATPGPPFLSRRRRLEPPVAAPVVRGFGREVDAEFLTQTFHSGVVFDAPLGTPVEAVAQGTVRFAGWFRGYGRLVILDHGDGYFTVSGHLDHLGVEVGDAVADRQAIGTVGETGSLAGPRLYFEIRQGAQAQDPADWLRPGAAR